MMLLKSRFLMPLATLAALFGLACGGAEHTSYPGPEPLTLVIQDPAEGVVVDRASLTLHGQVSQPDAFVACAGKPVAVDRQGRFQADLQLNVGANQVAVEAWTAADAKTGRGSGQLPPPEKVAAKVVRNVIYQHPSLTLQVAAPSEGAIFATAEVSAQGTVSDPTATVTVSVARGGAADGGIIPLSVDAAGHFQGTLTLQPGANTLAFLATASGDRTATVMRRATYTAPEPPAPGSLAVAIQTPPEGLLTRAANLSVSGTLSGPAASLTVYDQPVTPGASGAWSLVIAPPEGPIAITARAIAGNLTAQDVRHIVVDRTPPRIALTRPVPALTNQPTLLLQGTVDDPAALLTLENAALTLDASGNFSASYGLHEGANVLHFRAVDSAGNVGTLEVSAALDTVSPVVTILTPVEGWTSNQRATAITGQVDDPAARVMVAGQAVTPDAQGRFRISYTPAAEGPQLVVALATDASGNTGHATRGFTLDWTPPALAWVDPTPSEGALIANGTISAAASISKAATVTLNGQALALQSSSGSAAGMPYAVTSSLPAQEGAVALTLAAVDAAGNSSQIQRKLEVGTTIPNVVIESPLEGAQIRDASTTLVGRVEGSAFTNPITLSLNGVAMVLGSDGRFSFPVALQEGANAFTVTAVNRFGLKGQATRDVHRYSTPFDIRIDWPLEGAALVDTSIQVLGHVLREGTSVRVNGIPASVDPATLAFSVQVPLQAGPNTLTASGRDQAGNAGSASVHVISAPSKSAHATYHWDLPGDGSTTPLRTIPISGRADLPGVSSVSLNGQPLTLRGMGSDGTFDGTISLPVAGPNALILQVTTMAGDSYTERREVKFVPALPQIQLQVPGSARPGDTVSIQVTPAAGTRLAKVDLTWNGRFLATVTAPWSPVPATVPADTAPGSQLSVAALGTDEQGATVTARTYVTVYGQGALLVKAYDDSLGLPLTDQKATAAVENGAENQAFDAHGRAALATALPQSWVRIGKTGFTPVWRSGALLVGGVQAVVDARLTPLAASRNVDASGFTDSFAGGSATLTLPSGALTASGTLSMTPLSTQGLPALLPQGWSAVSAWWMDMSTAVLAAPAFLRLDLTKSSPAPVLPNDAQYAWIHWDAAQHAWMVLSAPLTADALTGLLLPEAGGYALVVADPAPAAPPAPVNGSPLAGFAGRGWREGLAASGSIQPSLLPTVEAINGAKATASFTLGFNGGDPIPSGTITQLDVLESYTLLDQSIIEPDGFTQDMVMCRWVLKVADGIPVLTAAGTPDAPGLGLHAPIRMSRTFDSGQLVQGRILVGLYHDGTQLASDGSGLIGASGGTVSQGGVNVTLAAGAVSSATLVRIQTDTGDLDPLWPELTGQGALAASFEVDVVGTLTAGLAFSLDALASVPAEARPLLLKRCTVQGQRLIVAVGEMANHGTAWALRVPSGGNPLLEGGSFAVWVPAAAWEWVSGTASVPGSLGENLVRKLGAKARLTPMKAAAFGIQPSTSASSLDQAMADVVVDGGFLLAVSGETGAFAVPVGVPAAGSSAIVKGTRYDLGLTGTFTAQVPSSGNRLDLDVRPFQIEALTPEEGATVGQGQVLVVATSVAMDPASLASVRLYQVSSPTTRTKNLLSRFSAEPSEASPVSSPAVTGASRVPANRSAHEGKEAGDHRRAKRSEPNASKHALLLQAESESDPSSVEILLQRNLSQDGRTLILVPSTPLPLGSEFRLVVSGLQGMGGGTAPEVERRFQTPAIAVIPEADLAQISISYPDASYNVTVTIPAGAVAPWSVVEIADSGMGSHGTGVMPPTGELTFQMKAALGDRLAVTVQLRDGRVIYGNMGRYVASDGRTTLGVDGGRVEGPGGLAVLVPAGALAAPVELQVQPLPQVPILAPEALMPGEQTAPGLRLVAPAAITFEVPPVIEIPVGALPAGVNLQPRTDGNGPVAVFHTETRTLPDGTQDVYHVLTDTARLSVDGTKLISFGGLRVADPVAGSVQIKASVACQAVSQAASSSKGNSPESAKLALKTEQVPVAMLGLAGALYDVFLLGFSESASPGWSYTSGTVYRNWNGLGGCGGSASAGCYGYLPGAEVYRYIGTAGIEEARKGRLSRGRMLAACDSQGRYLNVGGPDAGNVIPGQSWIALYAVDPRTGETSIDPGSPTAPSLGLPWTNSSHSLAITSQGGNPFDPTLTAPRIKAYLVDDKGERRSMFAIGEPATLKLELDAGSQPVVRGNVAGAITRSFGALPQDIPVVFSADQEGTWHVDVSGWTAKPVQGNTSVDAIVTPAGKLGANQPGKPTISDMDPKNGDSDVAPSAMVKITFNEPVRGTSTSAFGLSSNGADVPFRVISNGQEVKDASTLLQAVWLVPDARLPLGAKITVEANPLIEDQDGNAMERKAWSFTIHGADTVGTLTNAGQYTAMVMNKGTLYAVEDQGIIEAQGVLGTSGHKYAIRMVDVTDPSQPKRGLAFGEHGSWEPKGSVYQGWASTYYPFWMHEVNDLRVAQGVNVNGKSRDLLLVSSRPYQAKEVYAWENDGIMDWRSRHNALWVFDITGDADAKGPDGEPKLLMCSSLGTLSDTWAKGVGSAGGVLGAIKLRGGMTLWSADAWWNGFTSDAQALEANGTAWNGVQVLARRARTDKGYFPDPKTLVASNGFYNPASGSMPSVTSAVITADGFGMPVGFATMGYSEGYLTLIDPRLGSNAQPAEAKATFQGGGPHSMDGRLHDLSVAVNDEPANILETLNGTWQGPNGTEQGTLLFAGTTTTQNSVHFWALNPDLTDLTRPTTVQLGYADITALAMGAQLGGVTRISRIQTDSARMLVGVEAGGHAWIFDLKNFTTALTGPATLQPIYDFAVSGPWMLDSGMLYQDQNSTAGKQLVVKNIDGPQIIPMLGIPAQVDASQWLAGINTTFSSEAARASKSAKMTSVSEQTIPLPQQLMYAMTRLQGENGYPYLRYYYPDLGDMQISAVMEYLDPRIFNELVKDNSTWFVEAEGGVYEKGIQLPNVLDIQALEIIRSSNGWEDQVVPVGGVRSRLYGDGDLAKVELERQKMSYFGSSNSIPQSRKFAYSPFRFSLTSSMLATRAHDLRVDFNEDFRIKIKLKLYDGKVNYPSRPIQTRLYEFIIKFNANTTVHDVIRGGVWHYDPQVSATDPGQTLDNPAMGLWETFLRSQPQNSDVASLPRNLQERLSKTLKQEVTGNPGIPLMKYDLPTMGLDEVQAGLDRALIWLRRRVFTSPEQDGQAGPMPLAQRPTFAAPVYTGDPDSRWAVHQGDPPGAFGYRMAQVINGLQSFASYETGTDGYRSINNARSWGHDPANFPWEINSELTTEKQIDGRLFPILSQNFKIDAITYNPQNVMVHYLVAYPKLRSWGTPSNALYPINVLLTRDLLIGPMGTFIDANHPITGRSLKAERQDIDKIIRVINSLPNWSEMDDKAREDYVGNYDALKRALVKQDIVVDVAGDYFNKGLGILQLILAENIHISRIKSQKFLPFQNSNIAYLTADPQNWNYTWDSNFNANILADMGAFVYNHLGAGRMEILINGIQNKIEEVDEAAQALQKKMDEFLHVVDLRVRTPVLAQYNVSSKLYYGSGLLDYWGDIGDCIAQKEDTANPARPTQNQDSIRLIATLRAFVQILWSRDYQRSFYLKNMDPALPLEYWNISPKGIEVKSLIDLFKADAPISELDLSSVQRVPKYHTTLEEDLPVEDKHKSNEEIMKERADLIEIVAKAFNVRLKNELNRLYTKLSNFPLTLHAHSQGALIAAVAHSRLGSVPATRKNLYGVTEKPVIVANQIDFISYGGAANMYDWGTLKYFKSYCHHVNKNDFVTKLGMGDPFQLIAKTMLNAAGCIGDWIQILDEHAAQIRLVPPRELWDSWKNLHKVIFHKSSFSFINIAEHNFVRGYVCNINNDYLGLTSLNYPNKFEGRTFCNDL